MQEIQIKLSEEEKKFLAEILEISISDLSAEVADTDNMDFREKLKAKKNILKRILSKLQ